MRKDKPLLNHEGHKGHQERRKTILFVLETERLSPKNGSLVPFVPFVVQSVEVL